MRHVIGTVQSVRFLNSTANANPRAVVTILTVSGELVEHQTMDDAAVAYGIDGTAYLDRVHVFQLTDAGRIRAVDIDATSAYHRLVSDFPRGATVSTLTTRTPSGSPRVRILAADRTGDAVDDVSFAVAVLTRARADRRRGGVIVPGVGTEPAHKVVHNLAHALYGDGNALIRHAV